MKKFYPFVLSGFLMLPFTGTNLIAQQISSLVSRLQTEELPKTNVNIDSLIATAKEIESKRTPFSSCYITSDGNLFERNSSEIINYPDSLGNLQPIKIQLRKEGNKWVADKQPNPCYANTDGSTAIGIGNGQEIMYNIDNKVNSEWFSEQIASTSCKQIIFKMGTDIQKKVTFKVNGIETDYIVSNPISNGISISEEIQYPVNCSFIADRNKGKIVEGKWQGNYLLLSNDGHILAKFNAPLCYDAAGRMCIGYYQLINENGKHILKTIVPDEWVKNATYPITIDPSVTGPTTIWSGGNMPTCLLPNYSTGDSMQITIPGGVTVTQLYIGTSLQSNLAAVPIIYTNHAYIVFATSCGTSPILHNPTSGSIYSELFLGSYDFHNPLTCCYKPSCTDQTFWLKQENSRDTLGSGCDTDYLYYSGNPITLEAYIIGHTDSTYKFSITPTKVCSNQCQVSLKVSAEYGVPPYVLTHPWLTGKDTFGTYGSCVSTNTTNITLNIPGCPAFCGKTDTILVVPPIITDACGDTASNSFIAQKLIINPTPKITASPDSITICGGTPFSFSVNSCIAGTTIKWVGSNSTSGSSSTISAIISDTGSSSEKITYQATSSLKGCIGDTVEMTANINPIPVVTVSPGPIDTLKPGHSQTLTATGGGTYAWSPSAGLSCTNCANPLATASATTTYYVNVTNTEGCTTIDSVRLVIKDSTLGINEIIKNDMVHIYPNPSSGVFTFQLNGINCKTEMEIYNALGQKIYDVSHESAQNSYQTDLSAQPAGIYLYRIVNENDELIASGKLIIQ